MESHQDHLSHEGTKGSSPCFANSSFANWLFGTTQKAFSARSNVLNSRVTAIQVLLGGRVGVWTVKPGPPLPQDSALLGSGGGGGVRHHKHSHTRRLLTYRSFWHSLFSTTLEKWTSPQRGAMAPALQRSLERWFCKLGTVIDLSFCCCWDSVFAYIH